MSAEAEAGLDTRLVASFHYFIEEVSQMQNRKWMLATASFLLSVPWVLFLSGAVIPLGGANVASALVFGCFQVAFAASLWLVAVRGSAKLLAARKKLSNGAAIGFTTGVALLWAKGIFETGSPAAGLAFGITGALASGASYGVLFAAWFLPYSRHTVAATACIGTSAMAIAVASCSALQLIAAPWGALVVAAMCLLVFLPASRRVDGHLPMPIDLSGSVSKSDVFVLVDKRKMYLVTGLSYFMAALSLIPLHHEASDLQHGIAIAVAFVAAVAAIVLTALCGQRHRSVLMATFVFSFTGVLFGSMMAPYAQLRTTGAFVSIIGLVFVNVFYLTYYASICKRKDYSDARSSLILGKTASVMPLALLLAAVMLWSSDLFDEGVVDIVRLLCQVTFVSVLLAMFYEELTRTRYELALKQDSTVALSDVNRFARETSDRYHLTDRECEVIQQIMSGRSVASTAKELYLSESTVKTHIRSVYKKLKVHNRQEMIELINSFMS